MANQLAQRMLSNLASKAGHAPSVEVKETGNAIAPVRVDPSEEKLLIDLIHLKETLYPGKTDGNAGSQENNQMTKHKPLSGGMISLTELAAKTR